MVPQKPTRLLSEIEPKNFPTDKLIRNREMIAKIVDDPLIGSCEILYDNNIETVDSSANQKDVQQGVVNEAHIYIHYDSLSEENRHIAQQMGLTPEDHQRGQVINIHLPITAGTSEQQVSDKMEELIRNFVPQEPIWIPRYTIEEMKEKFSYDPEDEATPQEFIDQGYFYDPETQTFYESEDHYQKVKKWQEEHPKD